jgi:hypothetical protein
MQLNVAKELAALKRMTVGDLLAKYAEVFGETTNTKHKQWLIRRIIWRQQALAEGDLSQRAWQRAAELANDADLRTTIPKAVAAESKSAAARSTIPFLAESDRRLPMPGSSITKQYKGRLLEVRVLPNGFEFDGDVYKSLSAVAKHISGTHCNGYHFFGLRREGGAA